MLILRILLSYILPFFQPAYAMRTKQRHTIQYKSMLNYSVYFPKVITRKMLL